MCGGFLVHTMKHCKRYPLHMRVYVYRTREITSVRNAENEPYKNGRLPCGRNYGNAIASYLRNEAIIRKTPNSFWSQQDTKSVSMSSLSLSCVSRR